eukprot:CAMPEP_0206254664 /NCGR_PEP_ID=MMETSP0047_2-20121206/23815_1 /ASSEMBLY_ACC=CAM_ASM_000192 /TAXON_ID=195065 /ORGANISM="Chroomonas mesostigmatica_cf, Strain CCMP1168" /LENGTH=951 /DNA_ID=CAMNT_0053680973 /DNA_START=16 /DNA_END=2871 /DNA_ORIENTATION=+
MSVCVQLRARDRPPNRSRAWRSGCGDGGALLVLLLLPPLLGAGHAHRVHMPVGRSWGEAAQEALPVGDLRGLGGYKLNHLAASGAPRAGICGFAGAPALPARLSVLQLCAARGRAGRGRAGRALTPLGRAVARRGRQALAVPRMCEEGGSKDVFSPQAKPLDSSGITINSPKDTSVFGAEMDKSGALVSEYISLEDLVSKVRSYCPDANVTAITEAYYFAERMHEGQFRRSGEAYFVHPVGVASIIADMKLDVASIVTGLLHDTVEDTDASLSQIERLFGSEISQLVDGVTKIGRIEFISKQEAQAENFRKMIIAMAKDIRVILVKLADRTHNIRTLKYVPARKQKEVARETLDLYAPLAHRLGIFWLKSELEDTSLRFLEPDIYEQLKQLVSKKKAERQSYTEETAEIIGEALVKAGLEGVEVTGRAKHFYSIYQKMQSRGLGYDQVHDLIAFRILVDDVGQCYQALGVVHSMWKPVPGRFKDYIALPKPNMYQSLHSTVIGPSGERIEVQIRTREMHQVAEEGISAHWIYKEDGRGVREAQRFTWLRQLVEWVQQLNDPQEFLHSVKEDLFEKEVYVFSPSGDLFALPKGSTIIDFAYRVHTELGSHCSGARVNGKLVPLKHQVQNGDTVEIITSETQTPHKDWLGIARTSKALARIRAYIKQEQRRKSVALGKQLLERELCKMVNVNGSVIRDLGDLRKLPGYDEQVKYVLAALNLRDEEHLLAALGYGQITVESFIQVFFGQDDLHDKSTTEESEEADANGMGQGVGTGPADVDAVGTGVLVGGQRNSLISFCRHCNALYGEEISGVLVRGRGITVHRSDCSKLLGSDMHRRIDVTWDANSTMQPRSIEVDVECEDAPGMLAAMSKAISLAGVNIGGVVLRKMPQGSGFASFEVTVCTREELDRVFSQLKLVPGVLKVSRGSPIQKRAMRRLILRKKQSHPNLMSDH